MSTKTTIKRVALVAAVALTLGGFSAVSASAAPTVTVTNAYDKTNGVQVVGGQATLQLVLDTGTTTTATLTGVGSIVSAIADSATAGVVSSVTASGFQVVTNSNIASETTTVVLTSAVAGTSTLTLVPLTITGTPGTAVTKTITWTASGTLSVASVSSVLVDGASTYLPGATQTLLPLSYDKGTTAGAKAEILATVKDGNGNPVNGATVAVTISGSGSIQAASGETTTTTAANYVRATSATTNAAGHVAISIANDGTAGVGTVTITAGTVSSTQSVTFSGAAASYVPTVGYGTFAVGANGTDDTSTLVAIDVKALDSVGNLSAAGSTIYATSSDKTVATITTAAKTFLTSTTGSALKGHVYYAIQGIKDGTATITFQNTDPAGTTAPTVTKTVTVTVSTGVVDSVSAAFDQASYAPGTAGTLNLTLKNAAGNPVADGTYTIFSSLAPLSSNVQIQANSANGTPYASGVSVTTVGGVAALDFFAPVVEGTLTIAGTLQSATTANAALSATNRGAVITASADVLSPASAGSSLAVDAANAATDAANAAAEEASNATEAASEALAAVNSLATTVASLIAGIKAQLTSLTALIKKIQAKVKA